MSTTTYFDREAALDYLQKWHTDEDRESAEDLLDDRGFCSCCGVDYAGLDRDAGDMTGQAGSGDDLDGEPLTPVPWNPRIANHAGRVDFDNDEGDSVASVRMVRAGSGYAVIIDQLSDTYNLIIKHTNE
ncbi:hypothetical protein [Nesterenkonia sp. CF4.4]|uniref:hypothetical protein n=1 Tax=Nesterenkonia sp. CF4.4 TaxID=3373079 RepID=UPI003EE566C6